MENDGANGVNNVQQFLDAEFGDNADIHICGVCKLVFADINLFVEHKKQPCGGFFITSVKSLHQRGHGRSTPLENAISSSCEIEASINQDAAIVSSDESLTELSKAESSSNCATEAEEVLPSLVKVNVIPETVTSSPLPCDELKINSGKKKRDSIIKKNPLDQPLSSTLTRPIGKPKKSASKVCKLRKYTCSHPGCEYACAYPKDLMRHSRIHSGEQPFECATCNKKFNRSDKLRLHMRSHTGEKPYHCDVCKYSTSDHSSLNKHLRIHTGEKPYRCQICPYASRNSSQLVVHLRTHTLDAPYNCKICQRAFKISTDLRRHEQLHTGEKPYKCEACDYKCAFKGNLKMHFRLMHSTENMQKCPQCDFATPSRKAIRQHLKSHKSKDIACPYSCCKHTATSLHPLSIHVLTHHKDEPFKCVYCLYLSKRPGNVCKHVKRYYPVNSSTVNDVATETSERTVIAEHLEKTVDIAIVNKEAISADHAEYTVNDVAIETSERTVIAEHLEKTVDIAIVNMEAISTDHAEAQTNQEGKSALPKSRKCKPKKRLSKNLKRAIVCKPLCDRRFTCHLCKAAFVREDSLRSHLRQHQLRNDCLEEDQKKASNKPTAPDNSKTDDTPGSSHSVTSDLNHVLEMDGFQPVLEAISDAKEQVFEQALRQSGIICLEKIQSDAKSADANECELNLKANPNDTSENLAISGQLTSIGSGQSQLLATITTLGSTFPIQAGLQEMESNAIVPLHYPTSQGEAGPMVYEVQHCYLVPFNPSIVDTTQYIVQSAPGGFVQFMNSIPNADEQLVEKSLNTTACPESKTASHVNGKNRPIMPKPQTDVPFYDI